MILFVPEDQANWSRIKIFTPCQIITKVLYQTNWSPPPQKKREIGKVSKRRGRVKVEDTLQPSSQSVAVYFFNAYQKQWNQAVPRCMKKSLFFDDTPQKVEPSCTKKYEEEEDESVETICTRQVNQRRFSRKWGRRKTFFICNLYMVSVCIYLHIRRKIYTFVQQSVSYVVFQK